MKKMDSSKLYKDRKEFLRDVRELDWRNNVRLSAAELKAVLMKKTIEAYFDKEVKPYVPDAWIDYSKTKVGYEIPMTRHFYVYEPPRKLEDIEGDIKNLEGEIVKLLGEVTK